MKLGKSRLTVFVAKFCSLVWLATASCKKLVTADLPVETVPASTVFNSDETATAAVVGMYSQMMPTSLFFSCGGTTVYAGLSADELYTTLTGTTDKEFYQNTLQPGNSVVRLNFWLRMYQHVYQANACIEGLQSSGNLSAGVKKQLLGEAKFMRAFLYFYLVNLFGDVPLVTGTNYRANASLPRVAAAGVWAQITNDLKEAKENLLEEYPTAERVRPNKWAAVALLARTYLYQKEWAEAEAEATLVINSGTYSLEPDLNNVFLSGSTEAVWQLAPVEEGFNTTETRAFIPNLFPAARPSYALTPQAVAAFELNDNRRTAWVASKTANGVTYVYPYKYKVRLVGLPVTEYYIMLRYAELFLIRAEARAEQSKVSEAAEDLNAVRLRAGLPETTATTEADMHIAIEQERRIEFFAEWGHRWLDLKRTGRVQAVMAATKPTWQPNAVLYPIPQTDILQNPSLVQNPGY